MENFIAVKDDHRDWEGTDYRILGESDAESCVEETAGGSWGELTSFIAAEAKVLPVVVLAMCTTNPPVGITLSAYLFLFPEFVGKQCSCLMKLCSNVKWALQYMAKRIGYAILVLSGDVTVREDSDGVVFELVEPAVESEYESDSDMDSDVESDSGSSIEEIEVVQVKSSKARVCFDEGHCQRTSLIQYLVVDDEKWKKIDAGDHSDDLSVSVKKSRITKIRRKFVPKMGAELIKKIVPRKLRKKSKKHQSATSEPKPISLHKLID